MTCLFGIHHFGEDHEVGAGIKRRVCSACGTVTIDLTAADEKDGLESGLRFSFGSD